MFPDDWPGGPEDEPPPHAVAEIKAAARHTFSVLISAFHGVGAARYDLALGRSSLLRGFHGERLKNSGESIGVRGLIHESGR